MSPSICLIWSGIQEGISFPQIIFGHLEEYIILMSFPSSFLFEEIGLQKWVYFWRVLPIPWIPVLKFLCLVDPFVIKFLSTFQRHDVLNSPENYQQIIINTRYCYEKLKTFHQVLPKVRLIHHKGCPWSYSLYIKNLIKIPDHKVSYIKHM